MDSTEPAKDSPIEAKGYSHEYLINLSPDDIVKLDRKQLEDTPAVELAHVIERFDLDQQRELLRKVPVSLASDILAEMDADESADILEVMREARAVKILEDLDPDDATDVVAEFEDDKREQLLSKMEPESAQTVKELLEYDPDSAGGIMTPDVCSLSETMDVDQAIQNIRKQSEELETVFYVYVVNQEEQLVGVVSMKDILLANSATSISSIMETQILGILTPDTDKEEAANLMGEYNMLALPVVSEEGHLLGIVTHDDVIDIIQAEATEDIQKLVGAGADESVHDDISYSLKKRHIWLQVNLFTIGIAAGVVYFYEEQIAQLTFLAVFMPIIAATGGNTGAQTLAVVIRSLALGDIREKDKMGLYTRELIKGLLNGIGVGFVGGIFAYVLKHDIRTSLVVWVAMVLTMAISGCAGALIPLFLKKLKLDPAQSSSIFLTTITDITGFFIFLSLGSWLLIP